MHSQKTQTVANLSNVKLVVADMFWISTFIVSWGLLIAYWNTWWAFLLVPLFVCYLVGLSEVYHQGVHRNLFARSHFWNRFFGKLAGAMLGIDFDAYRSFHLRHHRFANTPKDPEWYIYKDPAFQEIAGGWEGLSSYSRVWRIIRLTRYFASALAAFGKGIFFIRIVRWTIPLAIAAIGYLEGLPLLLIAAKVTVAWYLPLFLLLFVDIALVHSEHYATQEVAGGVHGAVPHDVQYGVSWNLKLPAPLGFLFLRRNVHAEHHILPGTHWTQARDQGTGRTLRLGEYLGMFWRQGPRP